MPSAPDHLVRRPVRNPVHRRNYRFTQGRYPDTQNIVAGIYENILGEPVINPIPVERRKSSVYCLITYGEACQMLVGVLNAATQIILPGLRSKRSWTPLRSLRHQLFCAVPPCLTPLSITWPKRWTLARSSYLNARCPVRRSLI